MPDKNLAKPLLTGIVAVFMILAIAQAPIPGTDSSETKPKLKKMKSHMPMKGCG